MKKPIVVWISQAVLLIDMLLYGLEAIGSVVGVIRGLMPIMAAAGGLLIDGAISALATWLFLKTIEKKIVGRTLVYFFWGVLFIYPVSNGLSNAGLFPPRAVYTNQELPSAALAELFRYVGLLVLIVWLSLSKSARQYLSSNVIDRSVEQSHGNPPRLPPS